MHALSEKELLQICRKYEFACPVCEERNTFFRLKPDIVRPGDQEGDGHPRTWRWTKPGFDSVDPKQFFWAICQKCRFAGELDDPEFRTAEKNPEGFKTQYSSSALDRLVAGSLTGKSAVQALGKMIGSKDLFANVIAHFHLGIFSHCLRQHIAPGSLARYYLRLAWIFRDLETYYAGANLEGVKKQLAAIEERWNAELPKHKDYPQAPELVKDEVGALQLSRVYFQRNYETLRESGQEAELRLRGLLAEIGFRIYFLTSIAEDYRKALSFFSGVMQQCQSIINDKSISGGIVNKARGVLDVAKERSRELRDLHKERGPGPAGEQVLVAAAVPAKAKEGAPAAAPAPAPAPAKAKEGEKPVQAPQPKAAPAPAPVPEKAPAAVNGGHRLELDQLTRQVHIFKEENTTLRERVKVLEEDNEKWRQVLGKDPLTGLPNRIFLFRISLPKILRTLQESGPLSCIGLALDQVAKINIEQGWQMGDRMLQEAVKALRTLLAEGEELYRIEGVNFAIFGKMSNLQAKQRGIDLRRQLASANVQVEKTTMPLTASLGVVTVERQLLPSQAEASTAVFQALIEMLGRAKQKGGNTVEVYPNTRF
ncbi:MAG: GGDEF domain-containing protein [Candidatus Latescibacteria bacterium]|nr:GGDEF domain-containing protein [Candidatus Latescibacterota bacterium]